MILSVPEFAAIFIPAVVAICVGLWYEEDLIEFEYQLKLKIVDKIESLKINMKGAKSR